MIRVSASDIIPINFNIQINIKLKLFPGKVFNAHYNLTRHMPVHTGEFSVFNV